MRWFSVGRPQGNPGPGRFRRGAGRAGGRAAAPAGGRCASGHRRWPHPPRSAGLNGGESRVTCVVLFCAEAPIGPYERASTSCRPSQEQPPEQRLMYGGWPHFRDACRARRAALLSAANGPGRPAHPRSARAHRVAGAGRRRPDRAPIHREPQPAADAAGVQTGAAAQGPGVPPRPRGSAATCCTTPCCWAWMACNGCRPAFAAQSSG
jgi:hypothetical protein